MISPGCRSFLVEDSESGGGDAGPAGADAPGDVHPDAAAAESCSFPLGLTSGPKVRVVYLVPSDREADPRYVANLELAARDVQLWVRAHMPDGSSFQLHEPAVEVIETSHPADYYTPAFWDNVTGDGLALTDGTFEDPDDLEATPFIAPSSLPDCAIDCLALAAE
jgi:hypothetical protein